MLVCKHVDKSGLDGYNIIVTKIQLQGDEGLGKIEKAKSRLKSEPSNYTFKEAESLLISLGFEEYNKGKSSGSRVIFIRNEDKILLHRPHPQKELKVYAVRQLKEKLEELGDL